MTEHLTGAWRKASYSSGSGACVEVAVFHDGVVGVRDSKHPETHLTVTLTAWTTFLADTKHSAHDL